MYGYNLLVSFGWRRFRSARAEIRNILVQLGDKNAIIKRTVAGGIAGVDTILDPRYVIKEIICNIQSGSFIFSTYTKMGSDRLLDNL